MLKRRLTRAGRCIGTVLSALNASHLHETSGQGGEKGGLKRGLELKTEQTVLASPAPIYWDVKWRNFTSIVLLNEALVYSIWLEQSKFQKSIFYGGKSTGIFLLEHEEQREARKKVVIASVLLKVSTDILKGKCRQ